MIQSMGYASNAHPAGGPAGPKSKGASEAFSGQILDNPISGERFVFHTTADDSAGALLAFDLILDPDGQVPGGHVHPVQQERFQVLRGTMKFRKGLRTVIATPGDTVVVPPGAYHRFANAGHEPALVRVRVEPALRMEQLYETAVALAREGRTLHSGMPTPLELALFMREFEQEVQAPVAPGLVRAAMAPLVWMAARRVLDRRYHTLPDLGTPTAHADPPGRRQGLWNRPSPSRPSSARPGRPGAAHRQRLAGLQR